jgi:hypothetical protein
LSEQPPVQLPAAPRLRVVSIRAIALACGLMPLLSLWVVQSELIWYSGHSTAISLFFHVTFAIFVLALLNLLIARRWPASALTGAEIMTVYVMLSIAGTFCSHDLFQVMIPMLAYPEYAANPQNRWDELILQHVPSWAIVTDPEALRGLSVGNSSLYKPNILAAWLGPLSFWFIFVLTLMAVLLAINCILRQPWTEKERLSFPIIQIPMMLATGLKGLLTSRLFWLAFALTTAIDVVNGVNHFYPNVPKIPIVEAFLFRDYLVERPWNAIADTTINLYPFVIGLVFFLPTDLAFSCWFFFLLFKLEIVLTAAVGVRDLPGFPFPGEQTAGGYLGLGLLALWLSRRHLRGVIRTALGRPGGADDRGEPASYRAAMIVLVLGLGGLVFLGTRLGGSWDAMVVFFVIFLLYSLAIARMRAELGPPAHDLHFMGPEVLINNAVGTKAIGPGNAAAFSMFFWFNRAYRAHFSAHSMEGFKIAQLTRTTSRSMLWAIVIAIVVGSLSGLWATLHALYVHGYSGRPAGDAFSREAWVRMSSWMSFPRPSEIAATIATGFGLLLALGLGFLRTKFTWWVWHPVGYATAASWSMGKLWFPVLLGWAAKLVITRYGGATAYRRALPFFVGLVMGEFTTGSLWCIYGAIRNCPVYHFWG